MREGLVLPRSCCDDADCPPDCGDACCRADLPWRLGARATARRSAERKLQSVGAAWRASWTAGPHPVNPS